MHMLSRTLLGLNYTGEIHDEETLSIYYMYMYVGMTGLSRANITILTHESA
jgi:hypothetical protein